MMKRKTSPKTSPKIPARVVRYMADRDENMIRFVCSDLRPTGLEDCQHVRLIVGSKVSLEGVLRRIESCWFTPGPFGSFRTVTDALRGAGFEAGMTVSVQLVGL